MNTIQLKQMLERFFMEDIGTGDVTTKAIFSEEDTAKGQLIAKADGVFAGVDVLKEGFSLLDQRIETLVYKRDGETVNAGEVVAGIQGPTTAILSGERVLLNIVQRMSGIATMTKRAVTTLADESIRVCDTRKTMPGLRMLDKYAVACGGGSNHRFGLYDAAMIKDNHIAAAGSLEKAVAKVKNYGGHMIKVEVETTNEREVKEAVAANADVIMFDNCTPSQVRVLQALVPSSIVTEASGGIMIEDVAGYQGTGVDYLSLGCLTHSVTALDLSFLIQS
ncbi:nicotinate-nucleotide pyrophosphorylase [carboxylating] [Alteribacillus persepolensis]|uniref:Probable nicotinate-nucleotide pyrophosphorylase [carboxylating] n=1 Tax=Alteribacillus persepolensis TaxID=568899 RepID=A0A1G8AYI4_9BACI|nr:carboxylating nicotinate-nucleotide diphosphorylase [Alteribacillus persepolensis]SDH25914.1 nicotinate-nucleotide pyrophosphorylase [carboxylating] [Alteribacillus persepolensis]